MHSLANVAMLVAVVKSDLYTANADGQRDAASRRIGYIALHCTMCVISYTRDDNRWSILTTHCYTDQQLCMVRLKHHFVDLLWTSFVNKFTTNRTDGAEP